MHQRCIYSFREEGMQLVQPSKFSSVTIFRTHSIGSTGMASEGVYALGACYVHIKTEAYHVPEHVDLDFIP